MKLIAIMFALLFVAIVADAQTVIYQYPASVASAPSVTYYNTVNPSTGQFTTGHVYTQPTSPTTGFQHDINSGQQSTYNTNGNSTVILPLNKRK